MRTSKSVALLGRFANGHKSVFRLTALLAAVLVVLGTPMTANAATIKPAPVAPHGVVQNHTVIPMSATGTACWNGFLGDGTGGCMEGKVNGSGLLVNSVQGIYTAAASGCLSNYHFAAEFYDVNGYNYYDDEEPNQHGCTIEDAWSDSFGYNFPAGRVCISLYANSNVHQSIAHVCEQIHS